MRIIHCIPSLENGGAERQLAIIAPLQARLGHEVHVAYVNPGPQLETLGRSPVAIHRVPARGNHDTGIAFRLRRLFDDAGADVVQTWLPQMDVFGGLAALSSRVPWILSERSSAAAYRHRWKDRWLRNQLGRLASGVLANSAGGAAVWEGRLRTERPVRVIGNACPVDQIDAAPRAPLGEMGVRAGAPVVIFVGRLTVEKNIALLLEVIRAVAGRCSAAFLICGDGPLRGEVERSVGQMGLGARVIVAGDRTDVWSLMKASDVFISTSTFEGQPNAVLEAMACGCRLVVSDIAAHREFLGTDTAALVEADSRDGYVRAVEKAVAADPVAIARAEKARRLVETFSPARRAEEYVQAYRLVVESK